MILYFSGTGNSRYIAEKIAEATGDELVSINDKIKNSDFSRIICPDRLVFVIPTYAWRIPKIVQDWIIRTDFECTEVWFVMNCGGEIGNAAKYNKLLCEKKHFTYMGTAQIVMPENYIAMFNVPSAEEAEKIIARAEPDIEKACEQIKAGCKFSLPGSSLSGRIMSGFINGVFYRLFVKADAFYAKEDCTGCGKCAAQCPLNNINLKDGRPVWGKNCTHCMACICGCPSEAVEYGKKSIGKPRYYCTKIRKP